MLMADMTEGERKSLRSMYASAVPEGVELIETLDGMALIRHPDARVELVALHGQPGVLDGILTPGGLDHRAAELHRFASIARLEMAVSIIERGPDVPPDPGDEMADEDRG